MKSLGRHERQDADGGNWAATSHLLEELVHLPAVHVDADVVAAHIVVVALRLKKQNPKRVTLGLKMGKNGSDYRLERLQAILGHGDGLLLLRLCPKVTPGPPSSQSNPNLYRSVSGQQQQQQEILAKCMTQGWSQIN